MRQWLTSLAAITRGPERLCYANAARHSHIDGLTNAKGAEYLAAIDRDVQGSRPLHDFHRDRCALLVHGLPAGAVALITSNSSARLTGPSEDHGDLR
ncbi:hypothetical protein GCM10018954_044870 [Kutzneria kofuensis]